MGSGVLVDDVPVDFIFPVLPEEGCQVVFAFGSGLCFAFSLVTGLIFKVSDGRIFLLSFCHSDFSLLRSSNVSSVVVRSFRSVLFGELVVAIGIFASENDLSDCVSLFQLVLFHSEQKASDYLLAFIASERKTAEHSFSNHFHPLFGHLHQVYKQVLLLIHLVEHEPSALPSDTAGHPHWLSFEQVLVGDVHFQEQLPHCLLLVVDAGCQNHETHFLIKHCRLNGLH